MLSVSKLCKAYAGKSAVSDVSFSLSRGEIVALLGANGSGKTTTVQAICKLIEWDSGSITIDNTSTSVSSQFLKHIGVVLGGSRNINWRLTAKQNADYFARMRGFSGKSITQKIDQLHTSLGLDEHSSKEVMKLSTGNKQKAALLSALSYSPDFVILDEPTLGLDFQTIKDLQNIITNCATLQNQGFLITSHDLGFIENICDRVIVLDHGKLLFEGQIEQLKARLFKYRLTVIIKSISESAMSIGNIKPYWQGRYSVQQSENTFTVNYETSEQSLAFIHFLHEQRIAIDDLIIEPLSMDSAYQALVTETEI